MKKLLLAMLLVPSLVFAEPVLSDTQIHCENEDVELCTVTQKRSCNITQYTYDTSTTYNIKEWKNIRDIVMTKTEKGHSHMLVSTDAGLASITGPCLLSVSGDVTAAFLFSSIIDAVLLEK